MSKSTQNAVVSQSQIPSYLTDPDHWMNTTLVPFTTARITDVNLGESSLAEVLAYLSEHTKKDLCDSIRKKATEFAGACEASGFSSGEFAEVKAEHNRQKKAKRKLTIPAPEIVAISALKKALNALKAGLPNASFAGRLAKNDQGIGHRCEADIEEYTGFTQVDFDHVDPVLIPGYVDKLAGHQSSMAVFVSPSGNGVKVIARIPEVDIKLAGHKETYGRHQRVITGLLAKAAGIPEECIDSSICDVSRACYIPFDKDCRINPEAEALDLGAMEDPGAQSVGVATLNDIQSNGGQQGAGGAWGGGSGTRQEGYRTKREFIDMCAAFADITLSESGDTVKQNGDDGSVTYGWKVECPSTSGHDKGSDSKSMIFFNEGADVRFPAGYKCFSPACEGHGWKWFAKKLGIPGQSSLGNMVVRVNKNTAMVMVSRTDPVIAIHWKDDETWRFMKDKAYLVRNGNEFVTKTKTASNGTTTEVEASQPVEWLKHPDRRQYLKGIVCDPTAGPEDVDGALNLFPGWGIEAAKGEWPLMEHHLREVICGGDDETFEWLMDWAAWPFQNLRTVKVEGIEGGNHTMQTEVAPVLKGLEGCGKGTFVQWLLRIYGPAGKHVLSKDQLMGNHAGEDLMNKSFIFADEALFAGDHEVKNKLKGLVTESSISVNPKFKAMFTIPTAMNFVLASNEERVVDVQEDNRRFCVLEVPDTYKDNLEYFDKLEKAVTGGELAAWLYSLKHERAPTWASVKGFPQTKGTMHQQLASCSATYFFKELSEADPEQYERFGIPTEIGEVVGVQWDDKRNRISKIPANALFDAHAKFLQLERQGGNVNCVPRQTVGKIKFYALCDAFFGNGTYHRTQTRTDNGRFRYIDFPSDEKLEVFSERF